MKVTLLLRVITLLPTEPLADFHMSGFESTCWLINFGTQSKAATYLCHENSQARRLHPLAIDNYNQVLEGMSNTQSNYRSLQHARHK